MFFTNAAITYTPTNYILLCLSFYETPIRYTLIFPFLLFTFEESDIEWENILNVFMVNNKCYVLVLN